ncbi:MAG TPA: hypothetical protein QF764_12780 [Planctomycetota bacterium]|jgi:hypothetical protein|nr:hypothetical protein [Planctomycetota bacterium]HJP02635.1 hypothetical protein [Planctomycetota bacterium]
MKRIIPLCTAALLAGAALGLAQIERLTLPQMVAKTDGSVHGTITAREVIRIDHPIDGPELYYTHLTIEGTSLENGQKTSVVVTYPGGWIDDEQGVNNSEAPAEDDVKIGNEIVAFYKWSDNMGGDLAANALYASHGGLYQVVSGRTQQVVLGQGEGYAVSSNIALGDLGQQVKSLAEGK